MVRVNRSIRQEKHGLATTVATARHTLAATHPAHFVDELTARGMMAIARTVVEELDARAAKSARADNRAPPGSRDWGATTSYTETCFTGGSC